MIKTIFLTDLNPGYSERLIRSKGYKPKEYILHNSRFMSIKTFKQILVGRYTLILNGDIKIIYIEESKEFNKPEEFIEYDREARQRFLSYWY